MVFAEAVTEAISKPGIQWANAKIVWKDQARTSWTFSFIPVPKARDDSTCRGTSDFASICDAAAEAVRSVYRQRPELQVGSWKHPMDSQKDLVCLEIPGVFGAPLDPLYTTPAPEQGIYWHPRSQTHLSREINYGSTQNTMGGFEKVGLSCRDAPALAFAPFLCHSIPSHQTNDGGAICERELAGFIDCCPDIKDFFLVLEVRMVSSNGNATRFRQWEMERT